MRSLTFKIGSALLCAVSLALGAGSAANAQDASYTLPKDTNPWPKIGTEAAFQAEYDQFTLPATPTTRQFVLAAQHQTLLEVDNNWWFSNLLTLQPMADPRIGKTTVLGREGLFAEELYGQWNNQIFKVKFGKFAPNFARAWYLTPGVYGQDFNSDYALSEEIGAEASYVFVPETFGRHSISVADFMTDRSVLSRSLFNDRGQVHLSDGGPANTRAPKSWVFSYDAANVPVGKYALDYQVSYATLARGFGDTGQERRIAAGLNINAPVNRSVEETLRGHFSEFRFIAEAVRLLDADGVAGQKRDYVTEAFEYVRGTWVLDFAETDRWTRNPGSTVHDRLTSASIGKALPSDTAVSLGIAQHDEGGVKSFWAGLQLSQTLTTCDRCLIRSKHY